MQNFVKLSAAVYELSY